MLDTIHMFLCKNAAYLKKTIEILYILLINFYFTINLFNFISHVRVSR